MLFSIIFSFMFFIFIMIIYMLSNKNKKKINNNNNNNSNNNSNNNNSNTSNSSNASNKYKKNKITIEMKNQLWNSHFPNTTKANCPCCGLYIIYKENYEAGHIIAESLGGETKLGNLTPICSLCNKSMGIINYIDFKLMIDNKKPIDINHVRIRKIFKIKIWKKFYNKDKSLCYCCKNNIISFDNNYICKLINKNDTFIKNLIPVCYSCSLLCITTNLYDIIYKNKSNCLCSCIIS